MDDNYREFAVPKVALVFEYDLRAVIDLADMLYSVYQEHMYIRARDDSKRCGQL